MATGGPRTLAFTDVASADPGAPDGARVVLVHGFTQNRACWAPFDERLATRHALRLLDAPGHGDSGAADADLVAAASLLADAGGAGTWLGYSMGGRMALRVALDHPHVVRRLVLVGASPGLADDAERRARRATDDALADRIEQLGVASFLDEWLALPLFAGLSPAAAHRDERLRNDAHALAESLRHAGTGVQEPLWERLRELTMPVLLLAGALDHKYAAIARAMADGIGTSAEVALVDGAGHTAHLEQPARTAAVVLDWLERTDPRDAGITS